MMKRLATIAFVLWASIASCFAAGIVPGFSLTTQYDLTGKIAPGCRLYVIQAGTTSTPQIAYQDSALTIPSPGGSVLTCDASGRLPQFFLADGSIKFQLTTSGGTKIFVQDGLLVVGPSGSGSGGSPVDPTTVMQTGHIETFYGTGILTGFVRANGRTIGSATSGATERANLDTQALFQYLWGVDPNLAVSTGRGVSAAADWSANKTITLPDFRSRALAGLDDMGNTAAGRLTATYFGTAATVLGAAGGSQTGALTSTSQFPPYTPSGSVATTSTPTAGAIVGTIQGAASNTGGFPIPLGAASLTITSVSTFTGAAVGASAPFAVASPMLLITVYLKL